MVIEWTESGKLGTREPTNVGFGSRIIRTSVERQLRGTVDKEWLADGLRCRIAFPLDQAVARVED